MSDQEMRALAEAMANMRVQNTVSVLGHADQGIQEDIRKAINHANKHARNGVGAITGM